MDCKLKKMQKIEYEILCYVDKFCNDNNITYFLSGGSCLGAVRHNGFIPWDEDIDIMMSRKDYDRFVDSFSKIDNCKYAVGAIETNKLWTRNYAKVWDKDTVLKNKKLDEVQMGVFIDVFPIDGLPSGAAGRFFHIWKIKIIHAIRNSAKRKAILKNDKYKLAKIILKIISLPFNERKLTEVIDKEIRKYDYDKSTYVGAISAVHYWHKEIFEKKIFAEAKNVKFEDGMFPIPVGADTYLQQLYGDYWIIPKSNTNHIDNWEVYI